MEYVVLALLSLIIVMALVSEWKSSKIEKLRSELIDAKLENSDKKLQEAREIRKKIEKRYEEIIANEKK